MIHNIDQLVYVCIFQIQKQRSATYLCSLINAFDFRFPFVLICTFYITLVISIFLYHSSYLNICKFKKVKIHENKNILDPDQVPQKAGSLFGGVSFFTFVLKELLVKNFIKDGTKPVFGFSEKVKFNPAYSAIETS